MCSSFVPFFLHLRAWQRRGHTYTYCGVVVDKWAVQMNSACARARKWWVFIWTVHSYIHCTPVALLRIKAARKGRKEKRRGEKKKQEERALHVLTIMSAFGIAVSSLVGCCCTQRLGGLLNDRHSAGTEWELEAIRCTSVARLTFYAHCRKQGVHSDSDCSLSLYKSELSPSLSAPPDLHLCL